MYEIRVRGLGRARESQRVVPTGTNGEVRGAWRRLRRELDTRKDCWETFAAKCRAQGVRRSRPRRHPSASPPLRTAELGLKMSYPCRVVHNYPLQLCALELQGPDSRGRVFNTVSRLPSDIHGRYGHGVYLSDLSTCPTVSNALHDMLPVKVLLGNKSPSSVRGAGIVLLCDCSALWFPLPLLCGSRELGCSTRPSWK